jgi:uncharacterized membrane protein YkoI
MKTKKKRKSLFLTVISAAILLTAAFPASAFALSMTDFIGDDAAKAIALELTGGGEVTSCKLIYKQGTAGYEVGVTAADAVYVVFIDAYTGNVEDFVREAMTETPAIQPQASTSAQAAGPVLAPALPAGTGYQSQSQSQSSASAEAAKSAALSKVGGGEVARVETHYPPHGGSEYKVIIVYGDYRYCVHINGSTGYVTDCHSDLITKTGPHAYNNTSAVIGFDKAKAIAVESAGGGIVTDCNLDYKPHLGALSYHIHVAFGQYEYCVELDASTGAVFKTEQRYKP